jgi:hypothetical protein
LSYNSFVILALQAVYPDHKFTAIDQKPAGYWKDVNNQRAFFDELATKLNIEKPEDWNQVTRKKVIENNGSFIISYYNGSLLQGTKILD